MKPRRAMVIKRDSCRVLTLRQLIKVEAHHGDRVRYWDELAWAHYQIRCVCLLVTGKHKSKLTGVTKTIEFSKRRKNNGSDTRIDQVVRINIT